MTAMISMQTGARAAAAHGSRICRCAFISAAHACGLQHLRLPQRIPTEGATQQISFKQHMHVCLQHCGLPHRICPKAHDTLLQGRFSGRLETKDDEKRLAEECKLLGPLLGGLGKRGEKSRLTLAKIVRGIATGEVRKYCEERERKIAVRAHCCASCCELSPICCIHEGLAYSILLSLCGSGLAGASSQGGCFGVRIEYQSVFHPAR